MVSPTWRSARTGDWARPFRRESTPRNAAFPLESARSRCVNGQEKGQQEEWRRTSAATATKATAEAAKETFQLTPETGPSHEARRGRLLVERVPTGYPPWNRSHGRISPVRV